MYNLIQHETNNVEHTDLTKYLSPEIMLPVRRSILKAWKVGIECLLFLAKRPYQLNIIKRG